MAAARPRRHQPWTSWLCEQVVVPLLPFLFAIPPALATNKCTFVQVCWGNELPIMVLFSSLALRKALRKWTAEQSQAEWGREVWRIAQGVLLCVVLFVVCSLFLFYANEVHAWGVTIDEPTKHWVTHAWAMWATITTGGSALARLTVIYAQPRE